MLIVLVLVKEVVIILPPLSLVLLILNQEHKVLLVPLYSIPFSLVLLQ